jgi:hypothetical protein
MLLVAVVVAVVVVVIVVVVAVAGFAIDRLHGIFGSPNDAVVMLSLSERRAHRLLSVFVR